LLLSTTEVVPIQNPFMQRSSTWADGQQVMSTRLFRNSEIAATDFCVEKKIASEGNLRFGGACFGLQKKAQDEDGDQ